MHVKYMPGYVVHIEVSILYQLYFDGRAVEILLRLLKYIEIEVFTRTKIDLSCNYKENTYGIQISKTVIK